MSELQNGCPDCPLYSDCKATNEEDARKLELFELSEMYKQIRLDNLIGKAHEERVKELEERFWNLLFGADRYKGDLQEFDLEISRIQEDDMRFLAGTIDEYLSGDLTRKERGNFIASVRLEHRTQFTDAVERRGCVGPTIEHKLRLFGRKTIITCNAPVDPLVKNLAEKPMTYESVYGKDA